MFPTLKEIQESEWYKTRPLVIQQAIDECPPAVYRIIATDHQCVIYCYDEPESGLLDDVTVKVIKTGVGGALDKLGLSELGRNWKVFGLHLSDIQVDTRPLPPDFSLQGLDLDLDE